MKKLFLSILPFLSAAPLAQAVQEGQPAPPCAAIAAGSLEKLDFNAYQGKVILIDFWATWCPPCKKSMPFLNDLRNRRLQDGFEIIGINVDEDSEEAKQFLGNHPLDYQIAFDPSGDCPGKFEVKAMPSAYLVDKSGKVRNIHLGFRDEDRAMIQERISSLLAE